MLVAMSAVSQRGISDKELILISNLETLVPIVLRGLYMSSSFVLPDII